MWTAATRSSAPAFSCGLHCALDYSSANSKDDVFQARSQGLELYYLQDPGVKYDPEAELEEIRREFLPPVLSGRVCAESISGAAVRQDAEMETVGERRDSCVFRR